MWTVKILCLISSFCLVCCIDVFCLSFVYKQQHKHFIGTAFILSISSHSLRGCTPSIIYSNSCSNIEILVLISIQLAADNWQMGMQNRKLSLSAWFKLSWIYVTRLVKGNKIYSSVSFNWFRWFNAMYRKRETENPNLVRDLRLMGRDNSWRAQCSDICVSYYIPFSPQVIKARCKVAHYCECWY